MEAIARLAPVSNASANISLLLAAGFCHDIGKIWSYTASYPYRMTSLGRSVGHEVLSVRLVLDAAEGLWGDGAVTPASSLLMTLMSPLRKFGSIGCESAEGGEAASQQGQEAQHPPPARRPRPSPPPPRSNERRVGFEAEDRAG
jgi:hypothetical protein